MLEVSDWTEGALVCDSPPCVLSAGLSVRVVRFLTWRRTRTDMAHRFRIPYFVLSTSFTREKIQRNVRVRVPSRRPIPDVIAGGRHFARRV